MEVLERILNQKLDDLKIKGTFKGKETVIAGIEPAEPGKGPRYFIEDRGIKRF